MSMQLKRHVANWLGIDVREQKIVGNLSLAPIQWGSSKHRGTLHYISTLAVTGASHRGEKNGSV